MSDHNFVTLSQSILWLQSLDLSPIEMLWNDFKQATYDKKKTSNGAK